MLVLPKSLTEKASRARANNRATDLAGRNNSQPRCGAFSFCDSPVEYQAALNHALALAPYPVKLPTPLKPLLLRE